MSEKEISDARVSLDTEWKRLKHLIPVVTGDQTKGDSIERNILSLIDGKASCEDIFKSQKILSKDGIILILLKLEKDKIISCIEPVEKLREERFEKHEAGKELEFMLLEKDRALKKISNKREKILAQKAKNKELKNGIATLGKKVESANKNIEKLSESYWQAMAFVDRLASQKMDMLKRNKETGKAVSIINEEVIYLKDEKWSAMKSIKELESKIENMLRYKETMAPKMSVYRSVVREAYKTLRDAQVRADHALKGIDYEPLINE
jgi:chromosome segregation ATPase